ncbi:transporter dicarboxylate/amino acid:cation Na+/H+ symporter family protein [Acinetobacter pittii]|uniref:dicarboxylate/amino acid:cation symporter n=1 Tax=Acinetobacter pittii TaxID=48296 RepID=UPI001C8626EF|nr:dicarboxylate/amino acid:cation symporter [Acinetobacter pittii]BCZ10698.1 transporter dicarboxylate/amino acid:cation Na+/H+ symporter family protein [Acinetobacter pittii]
MKQKKLLKYIVVAILLGILTGWICQHFFNEGEQLKQIASYLNIPTDIFLRLIKMIIAPLVFATIVSGIVSMGKSTSIGSITLKSMTWFITASFVSLAIGMGLANFFQPGAALDLVLPTAQQLSSSSAPATTGFTLQSFLSHVFPRSIAEAMANNDILQVLVFSIFFGSALAFVNQGKEKDSVIIRLTDELSKIMFSITDYVMMFAPVAVFAAIASAITVQGLGLIVDYGILIAEFYFGLLLLWIILFSVGAIVLKKDIFRLGKLIREPVTLAFATASSESAYPKVMDALNKFGVPKKVTSFVLPLGYSFNLDGSMMYTTFAVLFIAQAYNIDLSFTQQILILLTLMVTSKGIAGVSRASIVVISATLTMFHLPEAGILLLLGIDQFLDMGRTATNVVGNSIATAVVAKLEGDKVADTEELPEPVLIKSTQEQTTA